MSWPIEVKPLGPMSMGTLLWRRRGRVSVTAIAKTTFAMVHGGFALPTEPRVLEREERPWLGRTGRSPEVAPEIWPDLPLAQVFLRGHAVAPGRDPSPAVAVRMVVYGRGRLIDKTLHVFGDRKQASDYPASFVSMPLVYERTWGGPGSQNPVGVHDGGVANVVDPARPDAPASLGPRAIGWPGRVRADAVPLLHQDEPWEWPDDVSPESFLSAPPDQWVASLRGDEWIVLDGVRPDLARLATRLPLPEPRAWLCSGASRRSFELRLRTVSIDTDALEVSLVHLGSLSLDGAGSGDRLVEGDVDLGEPSASPEPAPESVTGVVAPKRLLGVLTTADASAGALRLAVEAEAAPPPAEPPPPPAEPAPEPAAAQPSRPSEPEPAVHVEAPAENAAEVGVRAAVLARVAAKEALRDLQLAGADLSKLDLAGANLSGMNLSGVRLSGVNLKDARLSGAKLGGADLTGADLEGADATQVDFSRAVVSGANFARARLLDANFTSAVGNGARFEAASGHRALFAQGRWEAASFEAADLAGADFSGAELDKASFERAALGAARFVDARGTGTVLREAGLADANLAGATLVEAVADRVDGCRTVWDRAVLDRSSFRDARLEGAGFARARVDGTDLSGASMAKVSLMGVTGERAAFDRANLEGADLRQTKLSDTSFQGALLVRANGLKATLTGARMQGADLTGASLRSAKLRGADLTESNLKDCDLRDADLEEANLEGARREGAKLSGASLKGARGGGGPE
jgi:uncharacterized protein YjbI with pentapeptide repeats